MRFYEGCIVVKFESYVANGRVEEYIEKLLELAHRVPVYVSLSSSIITTRIRGVLRRLAITAGTAVICDEEAKNVFENYIELNESCWIDVAVLIPYVSSELCSKTRHIVRNVDFDAEIGVPYVCVEEPRKEEELERMFKEVIQGGIIDIDAEKLGGVKTVGVPRSALQFSTYFMLMKVLLPSIQRVEAIVKIFDIPKKYLVFYSDHIRIDNVTAVGGLGQGYIVFMNPLDPGSKAIYLTTYLAALSLPPTHARASAYIARLARG